MRSSSDRPSSACATAFDKKGQAATFKDNVCVLRENLDFPPGDCKVLTVTTGLSEHNCYGIDFFNAVEEIKRTCQCISFSGGLSNLPFSFRGLNSLCDAMHTIFLQRAIPKGLNLSIINPGHLLGYEDMDPKTRQLAEEVILNKCEDGNCNRFLEYAEEVRKLPAPASAGLVIKIQKSTFQKIIEGKTPIPTGHDGEEGYGQPPQLHES